MAEKASKSEYPKKVSVKRTFTYKKKKYSPKKDKFEVTSKELQEFLSNKNLI